MKITTLLFALLLLLSSFSAMAQSELQRFTVTPTQAPRTVAVFPDHPDKAAIIFESTLTNLRFDSQMDGIVQIRDESASGRYILIIEPFTQIISITAPGFIQERMRIGTPEPREVQYFSVAPEERRQDVISVIFNVTPSDARLFVDDQQTDINQTVQIEPGNRLIRVEREGYRSIEDQITVSPTNISFTYSLEQVQQELVRITVPSLQAEVSVDNVREGATDARGVFEMFRFPGTYQLRITTDGYLPLQQVIEVTEGGANVFSYNLERNIGTLRLDISPSDAVVMVNRQQRRLVHGELELAPGLHSIEISRSQHDTYSENIRIERGETTYRNIELVSHMGDLQLVVSPSDARVRLLDSAGNEVDNWVGSRNRGELLVGNYTLQISAQGYTAATRQVVIERNETNNLRVALTQVQQPVTRTETPATRPTATTANRDTETVVRDVRNPATGRVWMDRNLGASRAATSSTDEEAYGDLYQWGRGADGHQKRNSNSSLILSSSNQPGYGDFILATDEPFDWRSPQNDNLWQGINGVNNPCPIGYRLPTESEWMAERRSWRWLIGIRRRNASGAFKSPIKLPIGGTKFGGDGFHKVGSIGLYWSSSVQEMGSIVLYIDRYKSGLGPYSRQLGASVRCIKD